MKKTTKNVARTQRTFWQYQAATVSGMLDGFEAVDPVDVKTSKAFIDEIWPSQRAGHSVLDIGAGIGRVTKRVLIPAGFTEVDLLDSSRRFLEESHKFVGHPALKETYCTPMNKFDFCQGKRKWSMIWVQWVAIYLPDHDFIKFFRSACENLRDDPNACVVLKENIIAEDKPAIVDKSDASVTRSGFHLKRLWAEAGVEVVKEQRVVGFPEELFPVYMYKLRLAVNPPTVATTVESDADDDGDANNEDADDSGEKKREQAETDITTTKKARTDSQTK